MTTRVSMLFGMITLLLSNSVVANEQFNAGASWGSQHKGQGSGAISGFDPATALPNYTDSPPETGYYGGVTSPGVDLNGPGASAMNNSETGKLITESILNTPPDIKPSLDAPFIAEGLGMKDKAETITGGGFEGCVDQAMNFTEVTNHTCERTPAEERYCTRTAKIDGHWEDNLKEVDVEIDSYALNFSGEGRWNVISTFRVPAGMEGELVWARIVNSDPGYKSGLTITLLGTKMTLDAGSYMYYPRGSISAGQVITMRIEGSANQKMTINYFQKRKGRYQITLHVKIGSRKFIPKIVWSENCPFKRMAKAPLSSQCTEGAETRYITMEGVRYPVYSDCWAYHDVYTSQTGDNGTCAEYVTDKACSLSKAECLVSVGGICLREQAIYSCQHQKVGNGKICGGEFFCKDGACAQAQTGTSNMFGQAVSALAAVASAAKDISDLNGANVRAFTGKAMECRQAAAGFNNCCKDSGWGQEIGVAHCNSEEKALGKAKEKKLTAYVGTYCSNNKLGVCLQKKAVYCQFDSKLAQIVQTQGRKGQLGISFGRDKSPDCRGITVDELQRLDFGSMDFSDFYSELEAGSDIPEDQALLEKAQAIIEEKMAEGQKP